MSLAFLSSFQGGNFNWECHVLFLPLWISERETNVLTAKEKKSSKNLLSLLFFKIV